MPGKRSKRAGTNVKSRGAAPSSSSSSSTTTTTSSSAASAVGAAGAFKAGNGAREDAVSAEEKARAQAAKELAEQQKVSRLPHVVCPPFFSVLALLR